MTSDCPHAHFGCQEDLRPWLRSTTLPSSLLRYAFSLFLSVLPVWKRKHSPRSDAPRVSLAKRGNNKNFTLPHLKKRVNSLCLLSLSSLLLFIAFVQPHSYCCFEYFIIAVIFSIRFMISLALEQKNVPGSQLNRLSRFGSFNRPREQMQNTFPLERVGAIYNTPGCNLTFLTLRLPHFLRSFSSLCNSSPAIFFKQNTAKFSN